jgi:hypothetical protein
MRKKSLFYRSPLDQVKTPHRVDRTLPKPFFERGLKTQSEMIFDGFECFFVCLEHLKLVAFEIFAIFVFFALP